MNPLTRVHLRIANYAEGWSFATLTARPSSQGSKTPEAGRTLRVLLAQATRGVLCFDY